MAAEIKSVTMAQAKEIMKDKTIDRDEAQKLGLSTQEAESLTKGLQGNKISEKTALEKLMQEGHISDLKQTDNDTFFGGLLRKIGLTGTADFLEDKDKKCTDGKDDGKLSLKEGATSFAKGLVGGIPKAVINHPIATALTVGVGAAAMVVTGGAAAPFLWGAGAILAAGTTAKGVYDAANAKTDAEAKAALENVGTGTSGIILAGATKGSTWKAAENAGVKTDGGFINTMKNAAEISTRNAKANYTYVKTGVITQGANATRNGVEVSYQGDVQPTKTYKINIDPKSTVEQNLANNPGVSYDATSGKYYVQTSWGAKSCIDPNAPKGYMHVEYGPGDNNAVEGVEFAQTYVNHAKFANNGTKSYIDPATLKPYESIVATKQAPGAFKVVPEGTKYVGAEGPATLQPKSVLRIDGQGRPYQSTVEFMFKKFKNLTPNQIAQLKSVDPEAAAKYGY